MRYLGALTLSLSLSGLGSGLAADANRATATSAKTVLAIEGTRFTLNDAPVFLLGFSYYGGLGASQEVTRKDLDDFQRRAFNWLRVWATWTSGGHDVSAVDVRGEAREPFLGRLQWLVAECDRRGMVVDVTLTRGRETPAGGRLPAFEAHERAVRTLVTALKPRRNWYLDLANERDVRDERYVSADELKALRKVARQIDSALLVTASFGGHDLGLEDVREALETIGADFLCPHRPRGPKSPVETEPHTRTCLELMEKLGRRAPVHYQEPFRRGYTEWEPKADDFLTDLNGALAGGAAGWCFHNGSQRGGQGGTLGRSFDLRSQRLFDQLDSEELRFADLASGALAQQSAKRKSPRE